MPTIGNTTTQDQIERGEVTAQTHQSGGPRRSWKRGGEPGAYDFKFQVKEDDGRIVTVLCRYAKDLDDIDRRQNEIFTVAREIQTLAANVQKSVSQSTPESTSTPHLQEAQGAITQANKRLIGLQTGLARKLVSECVISWRGAPIQYSDTARDELPDEICIEWLPEITNNSRLSDNEGNDSGANSETSS